jgi:hypothetical protein
MRAGCDTPLCAEGGATGQDDAKLNGHPDVLRRIDEVQAEQKKEKEKERRPGEHGRREQWRGAKAAERAFRRPRPPPPGAGGPGLAAQVGFGPWSFQK